MRDGIQYKPTFKFMIYRGINQTYIIMTDCML